MRDFTLDGVAREVSSGEVLSRGQNGGADKVS